MIDIKGSKLEYFQYSIPRRKPRVTQCVWRLVISLCSAMNVMNL